MNSSDKGAYEPLPNRSPTLPGIELAPTMSTASHSAGTGSDNASASNGPVIDTAIKHIVSENPQTLVLLRYLDEITVNMYSLQ